MGANRIQDTKRKMRIHSTVFCPLVPDEPYLVVASVLPPEGAPPEMPQPQKRDVAPNLEEAARKCCELASLLRELARERGKDVSAIDCSHCPTADAPDCGELARRRR